MSDYLPIDCGLHSELELLVTHGQRIEIDLHGQPADRVIGLACDVLSRDGAEYLELDNHQGERVSVRLDRIRRLRMPDSGWQLDLQ